jgi:hypothetical protein
MGSAGLPGLGNSLRNQIPVAVCGACQFPMSLDGECGRVVEAKTGVAQFFRSKALALAQNSTANLGSACPMS